jgi:hypothetical protein
MFLNFSLFLQHFCNIYFIVRNIRYRPNIRQHILAEYSFSAETENFVFGRSLQAIHNHKPVCVKQGTKNPAVRGVYDEIRW